MPRLLTGLLLVSGLPAVTDSVRHNNFTESWNNLRHALDGERRTRHIDRHGKRITAVREVKHVSMLPHVTRLHRFEHTDATSMLEAEARWVSTPSMHEFRSRRLKVSAQQVQWLKEHQIAASQKLLSDRSETEILDRNNHRAHAVYRAEQTPSSSPLTSLLSTASSLYVGPVGLGTVLSPEGCTVPAGTSSSFLAFDDSAAGAELLSANSSAKTCVTRSQTELFFVLDTGSTNIWAVSDLCTGGPCQNMAHRFYNHSLSETFEAPEGDASYGLKVYFGTGSLTGLKAVDDFHVGPFTVYDQGFAMVQKEEGGTWDQFGFEGILGLGLPQLSASGTPFFDNVINQKTLPKNMFAFYFSLDDPSANAVFWGGVNPAFYEGEIEYFKVVDPAYWAISLKSFRVGDQEYMLSDGSSATDGSSTTGHGPVALADTGTTFMTAQGELFHQIMERLPGGDCSQVTEETHPPMHFDFESATHPGELRTLSLSNAQYMVLEDDGTCALALMHIDLPAKSGPGMILGETFMRHYYTVFDRGDGKDSSALVGFATAKHGVEADVQLRQLTKGQVAYSPLKL